MKSIQVGLKLLVFSAIALVGLYIVACVVDEALYWRRHNDLVLIVGARNASLLIQRFQAEHGRYPDSATQVSGLTEALKEMETGCDILNHSVASWRFAAPTDTYTTDAPVVVARDQRGAQLVAIYGDGRAGISSALIRRPNQDIPSWIEVMPDHTQ